MNVFVFEDSRGGFLQRYTVLYVIKNTTDVKNIYLYVPI